MNVVKSVPDQNSSPHVRAEARSDRRVLEAIGIAGDRGGDFTGVARACPTAPSRPADSRRVVIDAHMHVWANDQRRYPFAHPYAKDYPGMQHDGTVEMLIEDMDRHGCTYCVLVQTICHSWDNAYLADCVKRYPARFKGHGLIDPTDAKVADKLEYWTKEHGLVGMRFSPIYYQNGSHGGDGWLDADESQRLWRTAEPTRLGV